jgi:xanthine dehydrogenase YagR molybdenum-binding subunit
MTLLGTPVDRVDGQLKVTGGAPYAGDVAVPGMVHAVLVLSTVASGRITSIDSLDAARMPGVLAVMSHLNAPRLPDGGKAGVNPPAGRVLSLLQDDVVHYDRQPVALVVAESLDQATDAAARVLVSYQVTAAQLDFNEAKLNAHAPTKVNTGPTDSARGSFANGPAGGGPAAASAASVSEVYTTPVEHHNPMEPHATVAVWQGDQLTLHDATQYISGCRTTVAKTLGLAPDRVRTVCPYVGGGFGCKGSTWSHVVLAAIAARQVGRPVKLVVQRPQMFGFVGCRPRTEQHLTLGAAQSGEFVNLEHESFSHTSMIEDFTEPAAVQSRILYSCPNVRTTHRLVQLNVETPTFQRAPGHATGTFALESAIDELSYRLNLDPLELRLRNEPAEDPDKKLPWSSRALRACYRSGAQAFGWGARKPAPGSMREGRDLVGWGYATATYPANRSAAQAIAKLTQDGMVVVQCGTQDLGTGTYTVMAQVAADALGFPLDRVRAVLGDSRFPEAPVSGGSQSTASVTPAVQAAALALRQKIIDLAIADQSSPVFKAPAHEVVIEAGSVGLRSASRREPVAAALARSGGREIVAEADADPGEIKKHYSLHSFGAVFVEVRVDRELRIIRVPRVVGRYSVGRLLNTKTGRSQLLGGVVWGLGMGLMEETVTDARNGRVVNANLAEYHVPTNADIGSIDVDAVPEFDSIIDPLGARGIGEIGITGVAAALANAVYHATGVRVRSLPITLDKILV